jgi:hypothetical protein
MFFFIGGVIEGLDTAMTLEVARRNIPRGNVLTVFDRFMDFCFSTLGSTVSSSLMIFILSILIENE